MSVLRCPLLGGVSVTWRFTLLKPFGDNLYFITGFLSHGTKNKLIYLKLWNGNKILKVVGRGSEQGMGVGARDGVSSPYMVQC